MFAPKELRVLNVMFKAKEPVSTTFLTTQGQIPFTTAATGVKSLLEKGYIEERGILKTATRTSKLYAPTEHTKEAVLAHAKNFYRQLDNIVTPEEILQAIHSSDKHTD